MEHMNGLGNTYVGAIHDWSGTYTASSGFTYNIANYGNCFINPGTVDWSVAHTYGALWVPQADNTPGHVTWYFDGQAVGSVYWLGPDTSTALAGASTGSLTPSSASQATTTYSVLDDQQLALSLQTDSAWPMYVDWVRVWQEGPSTATMSAAASVATPVVGSFSPDSATVGDGITNAKIVTLAGTAQANTTVLLYDGTSWVGNATVNANGTWSFTTGSLTDGLHKFTATDVDATGSVSAASTALNVTVDSTAPATPSIGSLNQNSNSTVTMTGTSEANAVVSIFDGNGTTAVAKVTAGADGSWTATTSALSTSAIHYFWANATDAAGNTGFGSGVGVLGTSASDTITSFAGNDLLKGGGSSDTFVFGTSFGKDIIADFLATGTSHDVLQFSHNTFADFASVLAHAAQVGNDIVITADAANVVTLKNVALSNLTSGDVHIV